MGFLGRIFGKRKGRDKELPELLEEAADAREQVETLPSSQSEVSQEGAAGAQQVSVAFVDDLPSAEVAAGARPVLAEEQPSTVRPLSVGYATNVGAVRQRNEDSALVITSATMGDSPLPPFGLFIVADGMGGHSDGHRASQLAARVVARDVMRQLYEPYLQVGSTDPPRPIQDVLADSLHAANWEVRDKSPESGTTLTAALLLGDRLYVAHVGDSRAYLIGDGDPPLRLLTRDHSLVQRLQDVGEITPEEAADHPQRNILYRAVGQGDHLEVDTFSRRVPRPGWLLLCSDGLWGVVPQELVQGATCQAATPQQACDELVNAALDAGGPDNISVVIVRLE